MVFSKNISNPPGILSQIETEMEGTIGGGGHGSAAASLVREKPMWGPTYHWLKLASMSSYIAKLLTYRAMQTIPP